MQNILYLALLLAAGQVPAETPSYDMVRLKAGTYLQGSPENIILRRSDEQLHKVTLTRDFFIGRYEVTQKFYQSVMGTNHSGNNVCPECPVEQLSWSDTLHFL